MNVTKEMAIYSLENDGFVEIQCQKPVVFEKTSIHNYKIKIGNSNWVPLNRDHVLRILDRIYETGMVYQV